MRMIGGSTSVRRRCGVSIANGPPNSGSAFARKRPWPKRCSRSYSSCCPLGSRSMCSSTVGMPPIACSHSAAVSGWHVVCAIKSNRKLDDQKLSHMAPSAQASAVSARAADRYRPTAAHSTWCEHCHGKLNKLPFEVCVLISQRHHRDKHPKYFLCTDLSLSAQQILSIYQKRWPIEVDNFYVKQHLGLADFRVQSYEATEKWFAIVFLALVFLQWRLNHAPPKEQWHLRWPMWCVNTAMNMHASCWRRPVRRRPN